MKKKSKILSDMHETALGMYKCGSMSKQVYLTFKNIYEAQLQEQESGNKVPRKTK